MSGNAAVYFPAVQSTRERCKLADWDAEVAEARQIRSAPPPDKAKKHGRSEQQSQQQAQPVEPPKPKKQKIDFSKLLDDKVDLPSSKTTPAAKPPQSTAQAPSGSRATATQHTKSMQRPGEHAYAHRSLLSANGSSRSWSQPHMRSPVRPSALPQPRARSLTPPQTKGVVNKVVKPSHKGGKSRSSQAAAAGLRNAVAPQLKAGPTKKQLATQGMEEALARMRAQSRGGLTDKVTAAKPPPRSAGSAAGLPGLHSGGAVGPPRKSQNGAGVPAGGRVAGSKQGMAGRGTGGRGVRYEDEYEEEEEEEDDDDWRRELRQITGYNPNRFRDQDFDDRRMEATVDDIIREEQRSKKLGRLADLEEERMEEERRLAKLAKKRKGP